MPSNGVFLQNGNTQKQTTVNSFASTVHTGKPRHLLQLACIQVKLSLCLIHCHAMKTYQLL